MQLLFLGFAQPTSLVYSTNRVVVVNQYKSKYFSLVDTASLKVSMNQHSGESPKHESESAIDESFLLTGALYPNPISCLDFDAPEMLLIAVSVSQRFFCFLRKSLISQSLVYSVHAFQGYSWK